MTPSPSAPGSRIASRLGTSDRIFAGPRSRKLLKAVEAGLERVEAGLAEDLRVTSPVADSASRYLLEAGGKRMRPMLTLLVAQLGDSDNEHVIDAAKALEMTHLGSLYHDDVMDGADRRRGVPSAHAVWGNNVAILTGDLLFARASQLMAGAGERAIRLQADTFERLVLGQMNETVGPGEGDDPIDFYIQVLADKTGSLIAAAAACGIIFSGAPDEYEAAVREYGEKVGVAFQLLDDVIDLSPSAQETGKVPGTDLRAGVPTMPFLLLARSSEPADRDLAARIRAGQERVAAGEDPITLDAEIDQLRENAVTDRTRDLARQWSAEAVAALDVLPRGAVHEALLRFADAVVDRAA
ncbi:polyprenyl synthetase family protein [Microbacterium gorillae]|uniref:polyprenyl synthetase family protein n=1 Tax=Microbacterium gorillae TaxID=1231063 RepID=UPI00058FF72C|nr:polyprenyl synthetase family protein [Microbacterium gorillae]